MIVKSMFQLVDLTKSQFYFIRLIEGNTEIITIWRDLL